MKKTLLYLAGAAALLAGCAKEVDVEDPTPAPGVKTITIQATIDPETRTTVDINGNTGVYSWEEGEQITVLEVSAAKDNQKYKEFEISDAANGLFTGELVDGYDIAGAFTPTSVFNGGGVVGEDVNYFLDMDGNYFHGSTNAVMVAGAPTISDGMYKFTFKHVAALFKVTYENVPVGTKQLSITTDQPMTTGDMGGLEFRTFENAEITVSNVPANAPKTITVSLLNAVDTPNQTLEFYAPIPTGTYGSVSVALLDGDGNVIEGTTKSKTKTFTVARGNIVALPTITLTPAPEEKYYVKVTSGDDLMNDGQYLIVYEMGATGLAFDGSLEALDATSNNIKVEITDNKIVSSEVIDASAFTISIDEGSVLSASGKYIGVSSYSNGLTPSETSDYVHEFSIDENGNAVMDIVTSGGTMTLRYNKASNQDRFRYYKSGQEPIALYLLEGTGTTPKVKPGLSYTTTSYEAVLGESFTAPTLNNPNNLSVTYASNNEDVAEVDKNSGAVTIKAAGTVTITASFAGDDTYKAGEASYTITVVGDTKISDVIAGNGSGSFTVKNVTVFAVPASSTAIIGDETGKVLFYNKSGHGLSEGDVITVSGSTTLYNGIVEFTSDPTATKTGTTAVDHGTPTTLTSTNLTAWQSNPEIVYVTGSGTQDGRYITVEGTKLYLNAENTSTDGRSVNTTGYIYGWYTGSNGNSFSYMPYSLTIDETVAYLKVSPSTLTWNATEFGSDNAKTIAVTLNEDATGYSISYTDSDSAWSVSDDGAGIITVYPISENTSTTDPKALDITITHNENSSLSEVISLNQSMSGGSVITVDLATATFNGKNGTYTEGWSTTGTGKSRTDCIIIGKGENITSPEFDLSSYSSVTISIKARRYGSLSGSKATIDVSIGGTSVGTVDATGTNAATSLEDITFTPTSSMTAATLVFTCTNASSAGSTHGAGINTITITATRTN